MPDGVGAENIIDAAIAYAKQGILIFPCAPSGKQPLTTHGFKDATHNETTIRGWWERNPLANIGAPAGANHWTVLDLDMDTREDIAAFAARFEMPRTAMTRTGKGRQLFFNEVPNLRPGVAVLPKVDIRTGDSYVVLPPSVHPNGRTYTWLVPFGVLADFPAALLAALGQKANKPRLNSGISGPPIPHGEMQTTLFRIAAASRRFGLDEDLILEHLRRVNRTRCGGMLEDDRIVEIARRMDRYIPDPKVERLAPMKARDARGVRGA